MEFLDLNNPVILGLAISGLVLLMIAAYFWSLQRQGSRDLQILTEANSDIATDLALARQGQEQLQKLNEELKISFSDEQQSSRDFNEKLHSAEKTIQTLRIEQQKDQEFNEKRLQQFEESKKQLKIEFENLAGKILDEKAKVLGETSQSSIDSLLKPFREQIEGFQKRVNEVHTESVKGNASLESEIKKVLDIGLKMSKDADNLTSALKGDSQKRGGWGEA
ncbi:MAG: DNA recombination protein RmuC, partial [Gammaproteobacteria bacterium]